MQVIESSEIHGMQSPHEHHTSNYKVTGSSKLKKSEQTKGTYFTMTYFSFLFIYGVCTTEVGV